MGALRIQSYVEKMTQQYSFKDPILDTSAGWEPNWYQPLFPNRQYIKQDIRDFNPPCIDIICDICDMKSIDSHSIGLVLNLEALERIANPPKAIDEIYRVLKPKGLFILTTYFSYPFRPIGPEHERQGQKDYWRFTSEGIKFLLRRFKILDMTMEESLTRKRGIWTCAQKITWEPQKTQILLANTAYEQNIKIHSVPLDCIFPDTKAGIQRKNKLQKETIPKQVLRCLYHRLRKWSLTQKFIRILLRFLGEEIP